MSQPDRETVYQALFTLLNAAIGPSPGNNTFLTVSRRIVQIQDTPGASNAPYLFITQRTETYKTTKGVPPVRKFKAWLTVYSYTGDDALVIMTTALNACVTAVENTLGPDAATAFQQLGVPISSVLIDGEIEYFEGVLGVWAVAVIPVELVANY